MFGDLDYDPTCAYQAGECPRLLQVLLLCCPSSINTSSSLSRVSAAVLRYVSGMSVCIQHGCWIRYDMFLPSVLQATYLSYLI